MPQQPVPVRRMTAAAIALQAACCVSSSSAPAHCSRDMRVHTCTGRYKVYAAIDTDPRVKFKF